MDHEHTIQAVPHINNAYTASDTNLRIRWLLWIEYSNSVPLKLSQE